MLQKLFVPQAYFKGFGHSIKTGVTCPQVVSDDKNTVSPILALIKDNYPQWDGDDHRLQYDFLENHNILLNFFL